MDNPSIVGCLKFLDWAVEKGEIPSATGTAMKSGISRVLGVLETPPTNVFEIDLATTLRRFANLNPGVSAESLRTYRSRIEKTLALFKQYLADPVEFRAQAAPMKGRENAEDRTSKPKRARIRTNGLEAEQSSPGKMWAEADGLSYPFPLRANWVVQLTNIPRDLKAAEADRLAAFLRSLAEDYKA